jgi:hypothetical protein
MADTPRRWSILETLQERLREIRQVNGYLTDAGEDVRLEATQFLPEDAPRITLYSVSNIAPEDARSPSEREFTLILEVIVPTRLECAHRLIVEMEEDIEQAIEAYLQQPGALPLRFRESLILERPDGIAAMAMQIMFNTRYRR